MIQLTPHFRLNEFACRCGQCEFSRNKISQDDIDPMLPAILEIIRAGFLGRAIIITSGRRCARHNALVDGSPRSMHLEGKAADIIIDGISPQAIASFVQTNLDPWCSLMGVGTYRGFVHLDTRGWLARWTG